MSSDEAETRPRILEAAWRLLETRAGQGVRMGDIAREAGVSRQAVYLHFPNRAALLGATTRYIDEVKRVDDRLRASREAGDGLTRLDAFVDAWCGYIPEIYGVARALMAMQDDDDAAAEAWADRMRAMREGCAAAVKALKNDGTLKPDLPAAAATDLLAMLLSVRNWEQLVRDGGWSQRRYVEAIKRMARDSLVATKI